MDPELSELIAGLCTRAGMIMEDASLLALTAPVHAGDLPATIDRPRTEVAEIGDLLAAAAVLAARD